MLRTFHNSRALQACRLPNSFSICSSGPFILYNTLLVIYNGSAICFLNLGRAQCDSETPCFISPFCGVQRVLGTVPYGLRISSGSLVIPKPQEMRMFERIFPLYWRCKADAVIMERKGPVSSRATEY